MSNLFFTGLVQLVESGLNLLLQQDPHLLRSLNAVAGGKRMRLICASSDDTQASWQLTVLITPDKLHLYSNSEDAADASIRGSKKALFALLTSDDPAAALHHPELDLDGDVHLIQALHKVINNADTRWDDLLTPLLKPFVGDTGMAAGAAAVNRGAELAKANAHALQLALRDFLQEESQLLPPRSQVDASDDRLHALRLRIDRLQAKIDQLRQHVTN